MYEHDGSDGSAPFDGVVDSSFMKSVADEEATISKVVPGESDGMLKIFTVGENLSFEVSIEVMLLL